MTWSPARRIQQAGAPEGVCTDKDSRTTFQAWSPSDRDYHVVQINAIALLLQKPC